MFILFSTGAVAFRYVAVEEEVVGMRMWKRRRSYEDVEEEEVL